MEKSNINIYYTSDNNNLSYINSLDIISYYEDAFRYTLYFFKSQEKSCYNNFIRKLFTYNRDDNVVALYYTTNIIGYFITQNKIHELMKFINNIKVIQEDKIYINNKGIITSNTECCDIKHKNSNNINKFVVNFFNCLKTEKMEDCNKENKDKITSLINTINNSNLYKSILFEVINYIESQDTILFNKDKYNSYLDKFKNKNVINYTDVKYDIILKLSDFIYSYYCIDNISRQILVYYILNFIDKNSSKYKIKFLMLEDLSFYDTIEIDAYDKFTFKNSSFKKIEYITANTKYGNFSTCGETAILNIINYYLIDDMGNFDTKKIENGRVELKNFYKIYPNIESQLKNINNTIADWLDVISNLPKKNIYNLSGDIHNNLKNIEYVFETILISKNNNIDDILYELDNEKQLEVISSNDNSIELNLNHEYYIFFQPGHGDFIPSKKIKVNRVDNDIILKILFSNSRLLNDFEVMLYIYSMINFQDDFIRQISSVIKTFCNYKVLPRYQIIYDFFNTINVLFLKIVEDDYGSTNYEITKTQFKKFIIYFNNLNKLTLTGNFELDNIFETLKNLTELNLYNFDKPINNSFEKLTNLKTLSLVAYKRPLYDYLDVLTNLETLNLIHFNDNIDDSFKNLKKLKKLIMNKYDKPIGESFNNLTNLKELKMVYFDQDILNSLDKLQNLEFLNIASFNKQIGHSFDNLINLKRIHFESFNQPIGDSLDKLHNLQDLYMHEFNQPIGESFDKLINLKKLILESYNKILNLDKLLEKLPNIKEIRLPELNINIKN